MSVDVAHFSDLKKKKKKSKFPMRILEESSDS